jgi:thioredoxin-related protein
MYPVVKPAFHVLVFLAALLLQAGPSFAQEIQWRKDYNEARREAEAKSWPLALEFSTESCFWCRKLEATTFQESTIIRLMNQHFVTLKVDAYRDASLTQALRIQSFPTVVLAGPDGRILATLEGYMDAPRFQEHLERVVAGLSNPEWMARDYQEATRAIAGSDYARALALLKGIVEDGKERPVQVKARQLLQDLEQQAAERLTRARQLEEHGQPTEALNAVSVVLRTYSGTQAAAEASRLFTTLAGKPEVNLQLRTTRARELLTQARTDYRNQQFICCLDRCEVLAASYPDLPEGAEAIQLAAQIKNNPEWLQQTCDILGDRLVALYMTLADTWMKKGQPQQAAIYLEKVVQSFPGTRHAEEAQVRLARIQGVSTWQAEFKKR